MDSGGGVQEVVPFPAERRDDLRANDAKPDPAGRLWVGTMGSVAGGAGLYRLDGPGRPLVKVLDGVTVSNGLGWSPDGAVMYFIDTPTLRVDRFDHDPETGELSGRRTFAEIPADAGKPDGMCVDAEGGVWVACWGGGMVRRYTGEGVLDRIVTVPTPQVTSCAFAGAELDLLVITTAAVGDSAGEPGAGLTYCHRPGDVVGLPVACFAG